MTDAQSLCCCGRLPASDPNPDCERCCLVWVIHQVGKMRAAQKGKDRKKAIALEDVVDQSLKRLRNIKTQNEIF